MIDDRCGTPSPEWGIFSPEARPIRSYAYMGCEAVTLAVIAVAVWLRWLVDMSRSTPTSTEVAGWQFGPIGAEIRYM